MTVSPSDPQSTLAQPRPLRFGMIGCGALGLVHALRLSDLPNVRVCAVSDPDADAMQRVVDALTPERNAEKATSYSNYRDLLRQEALDALCISSPNRWHVEQILAGLEHNLDVLCEKPLSMEPEEVHRVVEATERSGRIVAIAYQSRYRQDSRLLRRALQSGKWGRVTSVSIFACEDWITPNIGTWRHDPARCPGGFFADANGHQLDLLFWLTGLEADAIRATIETRGTPVPIVTWGEARLVQNREQTGRQHIDATVPPEGIPFTFTFVGDAHHWREEISIQTERADFVMRDTRLLWSDGSAPLNPLLESEIDPADLHPANTPDAAFIAALRGGPPVVSPPHTVWPVLRFTLAALDSAANGKTMLREEMEGKREESVSPFPAERSEGSRGEGARG
jgi:predicted dehydrogenase